MSSLVPTVDVTPWRTGDDGARAAVAAAVDEACRTVGFFQIVGHGVPDNVIADMLAATEEFFAGSLDSKLCCVPPSAEINRGYARKGSENLTYSLGDDGASHPPDLFEAFNVGPDDVDENDPAIAAERHRLFAPNIWPVEPPTLKSAVMEYFTEVRRVAGMLLDIFARALELQAQYFRPFTTHSTDTLRIIHYETAPQDPDRLDRQLGMGAHTDYGMCTVLYADEVPGLQIVGPDGAWHDVAPDGGAFLVNLGDLTAKWTNDRWRSTMHRVQPPPRLVGQTNRRRSVAFFHDGNWDALIECLPTCTSPDNPPRYRPVRAGEHLMAKLLGPRTMTASTAADTAGDRLRAIRD